MFEEYPFFPYSEPYLPDPQPQFQPWVQPAAQVPPQPLQPLQTLTQQPEAAPALVFPEPPAPVFSESTEDSNEEEKRAKKIIFNTAAVIILFLIIVVGFAVFPSNNQKINLILADKGGKISSPDGAFVIIPDGALSQDTEINITKIADGEVTDLYQLKPDGLKFLKPVTVVIPYKESGLMKGEKPGNILLEQWSEKGSAKQKLKFFIDEKEKMLRTEILEF